MGNLFAKLVRQVEANAWRAVEVYRREIAEYHVLERDERARAEALDYTLWLRRRTVELAALEQPLGPEDLALMASVGERRAERGLSLPAQQQLVVSHTRVMLQEIQEAAGPGDTEELMRLMRWFGPQGTRGSEAYMAGYVEGQKRSASLAGRVRLLTEALVADDPAAPALARGVSMRLHHLYLVVVVRVPARPRPEAARRDEVAEALVRGRGVPVMWHDPEELVALVPEDAGEPDGGAVEDRALSLVRDVADALGGACAIGTGTGAVGALAPALERARLVSRVAPMQTGPRRLHALADVFLELGVARLPEADDWLSDVHERLTRGPDLITTLDTYYQNDMNRMRTAMALNVHMRTLDYRLQRAHQLTGIHPGSTHGVRVLSVVVTRALARG